MFESFQISPSNSIHTAAVEYDRMEEMFHFLVKKGLDMRGMYSEAKSPIRPKTFFTPSKDKRNGFFGPPEDILNKTTIKGN